MALDSTTETISHFIGLFELAIEELRLRDQYETFKAEEAAEQKAEWAEAPQIILKAPYDLKEPQAVPPADLPDAPDEGGPALSITEVLPAATPEEATADTAEAPSDDFEIEPAPDPNLFAGRAQTEVFQVEPQFDFLIPGSVATLTTQTVVLSDNDIFGDMTSFTLPETFLDALSEAADTAGLLNIVSPDWFDLSGTPTVTSALAFREEITAVEPPEDAGPATVFLATGANATGIIVNGQAVDALPEIDDVLPAFLAPDPDDAQTANAGPNTGPVFTKAQASLPQDDTPQPLGHQVVTGANMSVNEVVISTNWLDAPVIAVGGDVVNMAAISQVNVMYDRDNAPGDGGGAPSTAINAAALSAVSSLPGGGVEDPGEGLPEYWHIERIEGDVTAVNFFQQYVFATDTDRVELSFSASSTYLGTGENMMANTGLLTQLGFAYDLIIIGGSMVTVNAVTQTNVLLDNDTVTAGAGIAGTVSTNDNLVMNQAVLETQGVDTYMDLAQNFADAMRDMAQGAAELARSVAQDDLFEGTEFLRALYISGDLIKMNVVEQTNILGDQDQVSLAMDDILAGAAGPMSLTTGSNALINSATITSQGMDSTVMAGGDVYEDALLYQAELIDIDGAPEGVSMTALANEAVAFLADDMMPPEMPDTEEAVAQVFDGSPSADVMQTVLS